MSCNMLQCDESWVRIPPSPSHHLLVTSRWPGFDSRTLHEMWSSGVARASRSGDLGSTPALRMSCGRVVQREHHVRPGDPGSIPGHDKGGGQVVWRVPSTQYPVSAGSIPGHDWGECTTWPSGTTHTHARTIAIDLLLACVSTAFLLRLGRTIHFIVFVHTKSMLKQHTC